MNKQIIRKLAKLANQLDAKGLYKEADEVDGLIKAAENPNDIDFSGIDVEFGGFDPNFKSERDPDPRQRGVLESELPTNIEEVVKDINRLGEELMVLKKTVIESKDNLRSRGHLLILQRGYNLLEKKIGDFVDVGGFVDFLEAYYRLSLFKPEPYLAKGGNKMNKQTIRKLAKLANDLDKKGFYKEADEVDGIINANKTNFVKELIRALVGVKQGLAAINRVEELSSNVEHYTGNNDDRFSDYFLFPQEELQAFNAVYTLLEKYSKAINVAYRGGYFKDVKEGDDLDKLVGQL